MFEKESRFENDGQEVPTPRTGLRASNTVATLTPREVLPLQGHGLPPIDFEEDVRKTDSGAEEPRTHVIYDNVDKPADFNVLPVDWPTAQETMGLENPEVYQNQYLGSVPSDEERRLTKLEGQVDGLLDRIAKYNIRAQHRI